MKTLLMAIVLACGTVGAQTDIPPVVYPDIPQFYVDALCFADSLGSSRLDVYIEVPYDAIHFTLEEGIFRARYEVTVNLYDGKDILVADKWWTENVETKSYDESVSPRIGNLSQYSFRLAPGDYALSVQVKEKETDKALRIRRKVTVRDFTGPFLLSDIMLVNRLDTVDGRKVVYPNISSNVGELRTGFAIFFEAYNRTASDSASVYATIRNIKGDIVQQDTFGQRLGPVRTSCFHFEGTARLITGDYTLELAATPLGAGAAQIDSKSAAIASRQFVVRWREMPVSITNLDVAIEQLLYITDKDKIDEMKDAPSEKKRTLFAEFWKKRDPTPGTERNELMEEYYSRVAYANRHFGHYLEGWKTDMGMVYIIFGAPNNVERHPFDINAKPYEVWTYYEQNRQFVFIDATGFGDYRLQNPIWDINNTRPR